MSDYEISLFAHEGGTSEKVAISSTSAQSKVFNTDTVVITPSVECFFRQGSNPTALSTGVDQILLAGNTYRISGIKQGNKLAFITTAASGSVYITPGT